MESRAYTLHMIIQEILEEMRVIHFEHLDSLGRLELLVEIEEALDKNLDIEVLSGAGNASDLVTNIVGYIGGDW